MTSNNRTRKQKFANQSLGQYRDPSFFFRSQKRDKQQARKFAQLCSAVEQSIESTIFCESDNPLFDSLHVLCVRPELGRSRLCVTLSIDDDVCGQEVQKALDLARGFFRERLARDLCRKRVPQITFALVPRSVT